MPIGFGELVVICIVLIIAVGPERLPSMMKTVGKTMRTLRQASRDLRESTGIDELLREDFSEYRPPPRPAPPPAGPPPVARTPDVIPEPVPAAEPASAAASLPSDAPVEDGKNPAPLPVDPAAEHVEHADIEGSLPSDAPVAAPEPVADESRPDKPRAT